MVGKQEAEKQAGSHQRLRGEFDAVGRCKAHIDGVAAKLLPLLLHEIRGQRGMGAQVRFDRRAIRAIAILQER